jgi:hypothetical protein
MAPRYIDNAHFLQDSRGDRATPSWFPSPESSWGSCEGMWSQMSFRTDQWTRLQPCIWGRWNDCPSAFQIIRAHAEKLPVMVRYKCASSDTGAFHSSLHSEQGLIYMSSRVTLMPVDNRISTRRTWDEFSRPDDAYLFEFYFECRSCPVIQGKQAFAKQLHGELWLRWPSASS